MFHNSTMHGINIPNYPPPPPPPPPPIISHEQVPPWLHRQPPEEGSPDRFNIFKNRLDNYLRNRQKTHQKPKERKSNSERKKIKLSEVTSELCNSFELIDQTKIAIEQLSNGKANLSELQWNENITQIEQKKTKLLALTAKYTDPNIQTHIQTAIDSRMEKRNRIRKRKEETKLLKRVQVEERLRKHQQIDRWLEEKNRKIEKERQRIDAAKRAEVVLADVHKRKIEAEKNINMFDSLMELNRVRRIQKGADESCEREFNRQISELKTVWLDARNDYNKEEENIRKFLKEREYLDEWQHLLFADAEIKDKCKQPLLTAEHSLKQLIAVRRIWDECIVQRENEFGSAIPIGWVIPNENPSDQWKCFQKST